MADSNYQYIDTTGVILTDTSDVLTTVQGEYKSALGAGLSLVSSTPQGRMITAETSSRTAVINNNAAVANQINPNLAEGVFFDAIFALTGGERIQGSNSTISSVMLSGVPSTLIPAGVQAQTSDNDIFQSLNAVVLDSSGNATVDFVAVALGPVPAPVSSLTQILTNVLGWENVTNPNAAVLGINEQGDQAARAYRRNTLAGQGAGISEAITSALYKVPNVTSLQFRENFTNEAVVIDGVTLVPNSIYVCVAGGADIDIATALLAKKNGGCNWNGSTTVNVIDPYSGQSYPVKFDRPTVIPIVAKVTIKAGATLTDPTTTIQNAIVAYANGQIDGEAGFIVGGNVSPFELGGACNNAAPSIYVQNVQISLASSISFAAVEIPISINEIAQITTSNIQVVIQ